ncbi:MAG: hypothetical protein ACHQUC_07405 [Chlamydiales bacterium]
MSIQTVPFMSPNQSATVKKNLIEYRDLRIQKEAVDKRVDALEKQVIQLQLSETQKLEDRKTILSEAHVKMGTTVDKLISGIETQMKPKLVLLKEHEDLLTKLESVSGELKACKISHTEGKNVTYEVKAFTERLQALAGEMSVLAKANAAAKK